jgi:UDP-GlcNAc:undecaprenyl-phosphate/decaprenyl-phosphate GlcNAc-1-phosphate transferase
MSALVSAIAFPVCATVIWIALRTPLAVRMAAQPSSERWHTRETPAVGGIGVFTGMLAGVGLAIAVGAVSGSDTLLSIIGAAGLLFAVGLLDDAFGLPVLAKLGAQGGAAAIVLTNGLTVELVKNDWIAVPLAVVWLIGMTNAFNLLDNMDGIAATVAGIACAYFAIDAVTVHSNELVLVLSLSVAFACAGFLPFNVRRGKPAAAFLGDSGSQVIGFSLAAIALASSWKVAAPSLATVLLPLLVLAVPIVDTALVTIVRALERRPIHVGGRDHTSHRLVYSGLSEKRTLLLIAVVAAALGGTSLAYNAANNSVLTLVGVLVTFALLVQVAGFLGGFGAGLQRERMAEMLLDFVLITVAFACAYFLRFEGVGPENQRHLFLAALPLILAARYAVFILMGTYSSVWRYMSARDAIKIPIAVFLSEGIAVLFLALSQARDFESYSRSVFIIDAVICTLLIGLARLAERAFTPALGTLTRPQGRRRVLIVGAGRAGRSLLRELRETAGEQIVGFVDDNRRLRRRRVHGVQILGPSAEIDAVLAKRKPDIVLVTIPDAPRERLDLVVAGCERAGVPCSFVRRQTDLDPAIVLGQAPE